MSLFEVFSFLTFAPVDKDKHGYENKDQSR